MEVFLVNRNFHRYHLIDSYISFIWTERYSAKGDFELVIASTLEHRNLFKVGEYLSLTGSNRLMELMEIEDSTDEEGRKTINVKGYSLEYLLEDRVAFSPGATSPPWWWRTRRTPQSHARNLYREICYDNIRNQRNHYTHIDIDETPLPGTIPEPTEPQQFEFKPMILYKAIQETCQGADLGFAIHLKNPRNMHLWTRPLVYRVYTGKDRTSTQSANAPVIFSPDLDNIQNTRSLVSSVNYKNVALVIAPTTFLEVLAEELTGAVSNRNRKVMIINLDDHHEDLNLSELEDLMRQRGREALANQRILEAFDGEIDEYNSQYLYGRDYGLGDIVEMRNQDGQTNKMMVTEQIFAADAEGKRSYPTLTLYQYVQPGSWAGWDQNKQWGELTTEEWATMP